MPTSNRLVFPRSLTSDSVTSRTAVYGPVRAVVWQGSVGDRRPYADLVRKYLVTAKITSSHLDLKRARIPSGFGAVRRHSAIWRLCRHAAQPGVADCFYFGRTLPNLRAGRGGSSTRGPDYGI